MKVFIVIIVSLFLLSVTNAQSRSSFCNAVEGGNFKKVARQFNKQVKCRKWGKTFDNGPGSGMQVTHVYDLDTLTLWLKNMPCVADAYWDKCQVKIGIYPGWVEIGAKFNTRDGIREMCFCLQEGTTGAIHILGWQPHLFKSKNKLILKRLYDCEGFIDKQKANCLQYH
jgi:hypothetical protein